MVTEAKVIGNRKLITEAKNIIQEAVDCREEICVSKTAIEIVEKVGNYILGRFNKYALERTGDFEMLKSLHPDNGQTQARIDTLEFAHHELKRIVEAL